MKMTPLTSLYSGLLTKGGRIEEVHLEILGGDTPVNFGQVCTVKGLKIKAQTPKMTPHSRELRMA